MLVSTIRKWDRIRPMMLHPMCRYMGKCSSSGYMFLRKVVMTKWKYGLSQTFRDSYKPTKKADWCGFGKAQKLKTEVLVRSLAGCSHVQLYCWNAPPVELWLWEEFWFACSCSGALLIIAWWRICWPSKYGSLFVAFSCMALFPQPFSICNFL